MASQDAAMTNEEVADFFIKNVKFSWLNTLPDCVPPVRDQLRTHTSWAFAATSTIFSASILEGLVASKENAWMGSVEEIVRSRITPSTSPEVAAIGPSGSPALAYEYVKNNGVYPGFSIPFMPPFSYGLPTPPLNCRFKIFITSYEELTGTKNINDRIKIQPIVASMRVGPTFHMWGKSIKADTIYDIEENESDHAVTVVGYGRAEDGHYYYLIQNSSGKNWGVGGYAKVHSTRLKKFIYPTGVYLRDAYLRDT